MNRIIASPIIILLLLAAFALPAQAADGDLAQFQAPGPSWKPTPRATPAPRAASRLERARDWLWDYYRRVPPGGGWRVSSITFSPGPYGSDVIVHVELPLTQITRKLVRQPIPRQRAEIRTRTCPPATAPVWQMLTPGDRILIRTYRSGQFFREVVCDR